jgi:hypothetical protein
LLSLVTFASGVSRQQGWQRCRRTTGGISISSITSCRRHCPGSPGQGRYR